MTAIAELVSELKSVKAVTLIPYHDFGAFKYASVGKNAPTLPSPEVSDDELLHFKDIFLSSDFV